MMNPVHCIPTVQIYRWKLSKEMNRRRKKNHDHPAGHMLYSTMLFGDVFFRKTFYLSSRLLWVINAFHLALPAGVRDHIWREELLSKSNTIGCMEIEMADLLTEKKNATLQIVLIGQCNLNLVHLKAADNTFQIID